MRSCYRSEHAYDRHAETDADARFAKNWKNFKTFTFFLFIFWMTGVVGGAVWKISLIWGLILFAKGVNNYGWPSEGNWPKSDDRCSWSSSKGETEPEYDRRDMYRRPKRRPNWRKKDLV